MLPGAKTFQEVDRVNSRAAARLPPTPAADQSDAPSSSNRQSGEIVAFSRPLTVLIVVPPLHAGAADAGAIDLARILKSGGHRIIVASLGGRLENGIGAAEFVRLDVASQNPVVMAKCEIG